MLSGQMGGPPAVAAAQYLKVFITESSFSLGRACPGV